MDDKNQQFTWGMVRNIRLYRRGLVRERPGGKAVDIPTHGYVLRPTLCDNKFSRLLLGSQERNEMIVLKAAIAFVLGFLLAAFIGMQRNLQVKVVYMPEDIRYQIITVDNTWPDQFYCSSYEVINDGAGLNLPTYWTLDLSKTPMGLAKWTFHNKPLIWNDVNSTIREIVR